MNINWVNLLMEKNRVNNASKKQMNHIVFGKSNLRSKKDIFIKSNRENVYYETYSARTGGIKNYISKDVLSTINNDISSVQSEGDVHFLRDGTTFTSDQIPSINTRGLKEIKAENNCINFGKNQYFKYNSRDGQTHYLYTNNKLTGSIFSESLKGAPFDETLERYSRFWNYIATAKETVFMTLTFSRDEIKAYLEDAGIQPGFFTVKMGDTEVTRFYTTNKYTSVVHTKERYDAKYQSITATGGLLCKYEPGSVFKIKGKEYVLSENHTLDIPYGEDIYEIEYPDRNQNQ